MYWIGINSGPLTAAIFRDEHMLSCGDIIAATLALHIYNDDVWELILLHYNPLLSGQFLSLEIYMYIFSIYIANEGYNISLYSMANSLSHLITDY